MACIVHKLPRQDMLESPLRTGGTLLITICSPFVQRISRVAWTAARICYRGTEFLTGNGGKIPWVSETNLGAVRKGGRRFVCDREHALPTILLSVVFSTGRRRTHNAVAERIEHASVRGLFVFKEKVLFIFYFLCTCTLWIKINPVILAWIFFFFSN